MSGFSIIDWALIVFMLISMLIIGYRSSLQNTSQEDFLIGGRRQKSGIVGLSLFATLFSALSYLFCPGETIKYGPLFLAGMLSYPVSGWIVGKFLIPRFCKYKVASGYQILEIELGMRSRKLASFFFILLRFLWMSTIMYATVKIALIPLFGIDAKWFAGICLLLVLITVIYTTLGGIGAVLKTDALQSMIMFVGAILTIVVVCCALPDNGVLFSKELYQHWPSVEWKPELHTRMTVANLFFMELCWQVSTAGGDQMAIQRYLTVKDARSATHSFIVSLISSTLIIILLAVVGIMVMAYFYVFPQGLPAGVNSMDNADSMFPLFIRTGLPSGITGLIAAAIMAAAMSSLSSGLISVATVIQEDILKTSPRFKHKKFSIKDTRIISVLLGVTVVMCCLLIGKIPGNLYDITMKVVNLVVEPLFVLFFVALFIPWGTDWGAVIGGWSSLVIAAIISFAGLLNISELWIMPISFVVGVTAAMIASIFFKERKECCYE